MKALKKPQILSNIMICSTFGDISCFNYTKKLRIQMLQKLQKYNNSVNMNILEA